MEQSEVMELLQKQLSQRVQADTKIRYKLPFTTDEAEAMLSRCYVAEMIKRGAKVDLSYNLDEQAQIKVAKVAKWLTGDYKTGLLLYGTAGSGKSTVAQAVCELISIVCNNRKGIHRVTARDLIDLKTASDTSQTKDNEYKFNTYKKSEMLFIDDIGTEAATIKTWGTELTPLIDLFYHRYEHQLFTILTSNLDNVAIRSVYGERIGDRFVEMFDTISYTSSSYRGFKI